MAFIIVPSARSPVFVTFTPPLDASRTVVRLFNGNGAGVYFDFATFSFHVPIVLSAPKAARAATVNIRETWMNFVRNGVPFVQCLWLSGRAVNSIHTFAFNRT